MSIKLIITLGDPAGIGPEITLKALEKTPMELREKITIIGSRKILEKTYLELQTKTTEKLIDPEDLSIIDIPIEEEEIITGEGNKTSGAVSFIYLKEAVKRTLLGEYQGIITNPIAKNLWSEAGYNYPGQTELLGELSQTERFGMLFVARSPHTGFTLRTLLATTHIPLAAVSKNLNPELMSFKLELVIESLKQDFGIETPKIVIAGLNPHSGEKGKLGTEEQEWLIPWIENYRKQIPSINLMGPIPPDTMWVKPGQAWFKDASVKENLADLYIALYHDQGLIPVKLMAFEEAINTTIGLPFIRTSPDHGTAFDIAGCGKANANSLLEAIKLANEIAHQRQQK